MMIVNREYQFKSEEDLEKFASGCELNRRTAKVIGLKPFTVLDCEVSKFRRGCSISGHALVDGNTFFFVFSVRELLLINELEEIK